MQSTSTTRPTLEQLKALIQEKTKKRLAGDAVKSERESYADHTRTCEDGCPRCWTAEIAEQEAWEHGI